MTFCAGLKNDFMFINEQVADAAFSLFFGV